MKRILLRLWNIVGFVFTVPHALVLIVRHALYDWGWKKSWKANQFTICIGNLEVGGTGKTPHTAYFAKELSKSAHTIILSRGYGRKSKGFRLVDRGDLSENVGDEPLLYAQLGLEKVQVAVCEKRKDGLENLEQLLPSHKLVLLDDALQHRAVNYDLRLLLTRYDRLFTRDLLLPAGRLRDLPYRATEADAIVITKCPKEISEEEVSAIQKEIKIYGVSKVYFSKWKYGALQSTGDKTTAFTRPIALSGIAHPQDMEAHLTAQFPDIVTLRFPDHHAYTRADLKKILSTYGLHNADGCITTAKDWSRLQAIWDPKIPISILPIEVDWIGNSPLDWLRNAVLKNP